ncbi:arylesterase [Chloroflexi bacterium TSY]|nr:arylesterase [Chloroflexi bacterium TSY]
MYTRTWLLLVSGICLLVLVTACGDQAEPTPIPTVNIASVEPTIEQITLVAMGDSLTEGMGVEPEEAYPAQLERRLQADGYDVMVINAGISGETSSGALSRVDWVLTLEPDILILETGGNDGLRGIDPDVTEKNLNELVQAFQANDVVVVLAGMQIVPNMGEEYITEFKAIYPRIAEKYGLILIPFFLEGVGGNKELNQADAIHPTAEGYAVVVETLYPYIIKALGATEE